jgi:hypothetical protein
MLPKYTGILFFLMFAPAVLLFPGGKTEESPPEVHDPVWTLVITAFDTSGLSPSRAALAETVMREFVGNIEKISYRVRVAEEYAFYESAVRTRELAAAATALANKRNERDQLLYRGEATWRYRRSLKTLDADIIKLEESYRKAQEAQRVIAGEPSFTLSQENLEGRFPTPPKEGGENRFCKDQNADALITGSMSEYHGRLYITHKLYVRYTNSSIYEDSIIFSPEDSAIAMDEFAGRISSAISGIPPARLRISVQPENTLVLINHGYAGHGEIPEAEYPPGKISLEVSADNYESSSVELYMRSGELTDVTVNLRPLELLPLNVSFPLKTGAAIYLDSLYMGQAPLTLNLPPGQLVYVFAETTDGEEAEVIFPAPASNILPPPIMQPPASLRQNSLRGNELSLLSSVPYDAGEERVDKARRGYYWAWGGTWISAIAAWMINGYSNSVINSYNASFSPTQAGYDSAKRAQILNYVGLGLVGTAIIVEIFQMTRYIRTSGEDAPAYVD